MAISIEDYELNTVYITGGGYTNQAFTGLSRDTLGYNEVVWGASLTRSNTFALENIDDVDIGVVPQCTLVFKYLDIETFIILQSLLRERHLIVNYFDMDLGQRVTHEMAITGNERKKFYSRGSSLVGVQDFTIKLVGTNRDSEMLDVTVTYDLNGGTSDSDYDEETYTQSDQITIASGSDITPPDDSSYLLEWNTSADGTGQHYAPNTSITIWSDLTLYAIYSS